MDEALGRRLDAIERRLLEIEARLGAAGAARPSEEALPLLPLPPAVDLPPITAGHTPPPLPKQPPSTSAGPRTHSGRTDDRGYPLDFDEDDAAAEAAQADSDRYAANMRAAYDGDPPVTPVAPSTTTAASAGLPFATAVDPSSSSAVPTRPHTPPPRREPVLPVVPPRKPGDLEQTLGLKWAGWIGALVLVVGAALGIKFAYDQGWLGGLPNSVRCAMIAAAGVAMIGAGEVVYRRVNRIAATGLFGAGVAMLFLAICAGQAWYGLFSQAMGMVLLSAVALTGMAIAARADLVSVASLAVLGATAGPLFMGATEHAPPGFRWYLLAVQAMAVGLCAWEARPKWWVLRGLTLAAITIAAGATGGLDAPLGHFDLAGVIFVLVSALLFQGELIFTTWRRQPGTPGEPTRGATFSLLSTAVLTLELMSFFHYQTPQRRGQVLLWMAGTAAVLGRLLARRTLGTTRLGRGYYIQAVLLLVLAIPVMLHGPATLFGWLALASGLAILAAMTRDKLAAIGSAGVWLLSAIGLFVWADQFEAAKHIWLQIGNEAVIAAVVVSVVTAITGHVVGYAISRVFSRPDDYSAGRVRAGAPAGLLVDIAAVTVLSAMLVQYTSPQFATRAGLAYGLLLWAAGFVPALATLGWVSTGLITLVAVKWAAFDVLAERFSTNWKPVGGLFSGNSPVITGLALAAAFGLAGWTHRRRVAALDDRFIERADRWWATFVTLAFVVIGFVASVEIDRGILLSSASGTDAAWLQLAGRQLGWTILWAGVVIVWRAVIPATATSATLQRDVLRCARVLVYLIAAKFILVDVIVLSVVGDAVPTHALLNLRVGAAVFVILSLAWAGRSEEDPADGSLFGLAVLAILLATGSAEVDRYALLQKDGPVWIVRQVGWSIYWSLLAVATVIVGFALRQRSLRLAALGLLGLTLLKVTLIDLSGAGTGWRILSFIGLGALLLLTSILYGKFAGRDADAATAVERLG